MTQENRYAPLYSIGLILLAVVALAFLVSALSQNSPHDLRLQHITWWTVPVITALHLLFLLLAAEIWRRLILALTAMNTGFWQAYLQMAVIAVGKYVPGKIWGFIARTGQMHREKVPLHQSIATGVVEQILVLAGATIVVTVATVVVFPEFAWQALIGGSAFLAGTIVATVNVPLLTRWVLRRRGHDAAGVHFDDYHWPGLLRFSLAYAFLWLLSGLILAFFYVALFDPVITADRVAVLILANTIGFVAGFFAFFAPGGLGVREAVTTAVLAPFLPMQEALLAAVAFRAWLVLFDGANAILLIAVESRRNKAQK